MLLLAIAQRFFFNQPLVSLRWPVAEKRRAPLLIINDTEQASAFYSEASYSNTVQPLMLLCTVFLSCVSPVYTKAIVRGVQRYFLCFHFNCMQKFRFQYQFEGKGQENNFGPSIKQSDKKNRNARQNPRWLPITSCLSHYAA